MTQYKRNVATIVPKLLRWFSESARDLPWRRTRDPYAIWVSEIMLQQTQVKTVLPFWRWWMKHLPSVEALARARPEKVHKLWEGLGYYTRARNLHEAARIIKACHGGRVPNDFETLLDLPGVGRYTAGAICSIAFNQPKPILDGNVIRVLSRIFGVKGDPRAGKVSARLWRLAEELVTKAGKQDCSRFNQSLMELGATVCTPKHPRCSECPIASRCYARRHGLIDRLPEVRSRPAVSKRRFLAFVARRQGKFLVRQRPAGIVNAYLWEFPNIEVPASKPNPADAGRAALGWRPDSSKPFCSIRHSITRYAITMEVFHVAPPNRLEAAEAQGVWLSPAALRRLAFASAHKRVLDLLL